VTFLLCAQWGHFYFGLTDLHRRGVVRHRFGRTPPQEIRRLNEVEIGLKPISTDSIYQVSTFLRTVVFETPAANISNTQNFGAHLVPRDSLPTLRELHERLRAVCGDSNPPQSQLPIASYREQIQTWLEQGLRPAPFSKIESLAQLISTNHAPGHNLVKATTHRADADERLGNKQHCNVNRKLAGPPITTRTRARAPCSPLR